MAIYSPLRLRRQVARQAVAKQRLIIFQLECLTFALALDGVAKVSTLDRIYGDAGGGIFTTYQGREIAVIDVGQKIFGHPPTVIPPLDALRTMNPLADTPSYLIALQADDRRLIGLPIDSPPSIESIAMSAFTPLVELNNPQQMDNIHCVKSISISEDRSSIYLLNPFLLMEI
jgi:hypothetical protein